MTQKEAYIQWCESISKLPVFMQPWWLDVVCAGKQWDVLLSYDDDEHILAALPYLYRTRFRYVHYIVMPQMTQIGGIWLSDSAREDATQQQKAIEDITNQLDNLNLSYYYQHYPLGSTVPEMLRQRNFRVRSRVTYRIDDLSNLDQVIDSFSKNKKRQLHKALSLHADNTLSAEAFYRFHTQCMHGQHKKVSYSREFLLVLDRKTQRNQCSQIIAIRDADNHLHAAAFLTWDAHSMYYLIPCYDPLYKDSGAGALLVLEAIKLARDKGVSFDFEGSMIRGVANHYRQFGSKATLYYSVERYYHWWFRFFNVINHLREWRFR